MPRAGDFDGSSEYDEGFQPVPERLIDLPNGDEALLIGDIEGTRDLNHQQGSNDLGYKSTCGVVAVESLARQFGLEVTENDVVALAVGNDLCERWGDPPELCGGTTPVAQAELLERLGVPSHCELLLDLDGLASEVELGRGVIVGVNAGVLWNDAGSYGSGEPNHAVVVTGVVRNPDNGLLLGVVINDSGRGIPGDSGRFVSVEHFGLASQGFQQGPITAVVTDGSRFDVPSSRG